MKSIFILLLFCLILACKKQTGTCWHCSGNIPATGQSNLTKDTCTANGQAPTKITDSNGNDWNFYCTKQ